MKVPKGTSDYQATWIVDEDDENDDVDEESSEDDDDDDMMDEAMERDDEDDNSQVITWQTEVNADGRTTAKGCLRLWDLVKIWIRNAAEIP